MSAGRTRWLRRWGLVLLTVAGFVVMAWLYRWMSDDGLIHLRVVRQIEAGNGPVYNAGERVEVSTSIAWVVLLVTLDLLLPMPLEWIAVLSGLVLSAVALVALAVGSMRLHQATRAARGNSVWLPLGLLFVAVFPPAWHMATAGLENGLVWAWFGGGWYAVVRLGLDDGSAGPAPPWRRRSVAAAIGLGVLIRPDLGPFVVAWLAVLVAPAVRRRRWRAVTGLCMSAAAIPVLYQVFRMGYFGVMVPNTAIAKEASSLNLAGGWEFARDQFGDHLLWVGWLALVPAAAPFVARLSTPARAVSAVTVGTGLLSLAYVVAMGGDFMGSRMLIVPMMACAAPIAVVPVARSTVRKPAAAAPLLIWALVCGLALREGDENFDLMSQRNTVMADRVPLSPDTTVTTPAVYYGPTLLDGVDGSPRLGATVYSALAIGVPSFRADPDTPVVDLLGLGEPLVAHFRLEKRGRIPGHEKTMPVHWFLARATSPGSERRVAPDLPEPTPFYTGSFGPPPTGSPAERTEAARAALACPQLAELLAASEEPMSWRRFMKNLVTAPARTRLRVDANPDRHVTRGPDGTWRCREGG